jgi:RNA polymerase-binding protein DksA
MSLEKNVIKELKEKLLIEKNRLEEELGRIATPNKPSSDYETNFNEIGSNEDENASEVEEYTDNLALENSLEKQLHEIKAALERIETNTFGVCENCKHEIDTNRLRAYPAAKTCVNCK